MRKRVEIEDTLQQVSSLSTQIKSKKALRNHIIELARQYGFNLFMKTKFGRGELTVRTLVKSYLKYGRPPTTKILVIPDSFVKNLYRIYKNWPKLGEFFLRTSLWHEYQHLQQDPTQSQDSSRMEEEANKSMIEKMGRFGLIVSLWYFCSFGKNGIWDRVLSRKRGLDKGEARKKVINCLQTIYANLIPSNQYDEIVDEVLWLDKEYQNHKKI